MKAESDTTIVIRDVDTIAEIQWVEELQKEVWRIPDIEVVPLSQLVAAKNAGGVLLGAFDDEMLVGFAYGFVGQEEGKFAHHSHMVGVKREYRVHDLGFRLKAAQRERVLEHGIPLMSWTFDPLQSLNAYFNFSKLGAIAERYFVDFYGSDAHSFLHQNGTDRLWVTWKLTDDRVSERLAQKRIHTEQPDFPKLVECDKHDRPVLLEIDGLLSHDRVTIEIPTEIAAIEQRDIELARAWRTSTREAFTSALASGYLVDDFFRGERAGAYVLTKTGEGV